MSGLRRWERQHCGRTVLVAESDWEPWLLVRTRSWDRLRARWHALTLDAQLAAGAPAATDRLRAVRAGMLVTPAWRQEVAAGWERVVAGRAGPWSVLVQRSRVLAAADEIRLLVAALRVAGPVPARGVAIATLLLTDGAGPLYHQACRADLCAMVREAVHCLDPFSAHTDL